MRTSPSNGSTRARSRATTRSTIAPTVSHDTRSRAFTAVLLIRTTSHATSTSKPVVCRAPCAAHGTWAATTPCSAQVTRTGSASR